MYLGYKLSRSKTGRAGPVIRPIARRTQCASHICSIFYDLDVVEPPRLHLSLLYVPSRASAT